MLRILAFFALLLPASAQAATLEDVQLLLLRSGLDAAVRQLDLAYDINLRRQSNTYELSVGQRDQLESAMFVYRGEQLLEELAQTLVGEFEQQAVQPIKSAMEHELLEKFRRFERIGNSAGQRQKLEDYVAEATLEPLRIDLLRACHEADYGPIVAAIIQSFAEVDSAVALDRISGERFTANDYEGIKLWRSELEGLYAEHYLTGADPYLAYTYRFVRDEQLQQYAEIWQDRNVKWFMDTSLLQLRVLLQAKRQSMIASLDIEQQE
ncbi:MAG: hypothetical protein AB8B48_06705 [Pseudomonadales bacterium]